MRPVNQLSLVAKGDEALALGIEPYSRQSAETAEARGQDQPAAVFERTEPHVRMVAGIERRQRPGLDLDRDRRGDGGEFVRHDCFDGGCEASCARAMPGNAIAESPAAVAFRKRRRLTCLLLMVRRRACAVSNHAARTVSPPSRRGEGAAPQDEAIRGRDEFISFQRSTSAACADGCSRPAARRGSR